MLVRVESPENRSEVEVMMPDKIDKIFPGQLRNWVSGSDWGGAGPFVILDLKEHDSPATDEEPDLWVEVLVPDGYTDEYLLDEVMLGSEGVEEE